MTFPKIAVVFLVLCCGLSQLAPQVSVTNSILGSLTTYKLSYYSSNSLTTTTTFTVAFNLSYIRIADGANACAVRVGGVSVPAPSCACTNRVCTFKPMVSSDPKTVEIQINGVTNPMFVAQQSLPVNIMFSSSISYNFTVIIPAKTYNPMPLTINSIKQSDYGVGYTPVTYTFNMSVPYISKNMQMQVTMPPEITYASLSSDLSFYGTIQNSPPLRFQSLLIFNLQVNANSSPNGFMLLSLSGLGNPRFLGNSSSFKVTFMETTAMPSCATCKIAQGDSGITVESRVPGDVQAVSIDSSNMYIGSVNTLSINLQLYAGIPSGGRVSIFLPTQIKPTQPIECGNIYGFIFQDNNLPTCSYNDTKNRVDTVNFATPYFDSTGNGIISLKVTNPLDSRNVSFNFETYDASNRTIGQSRSASYFNALPMPMNVTITKTNMEVDQMFNMSVELVLGRNLSLNNYIQVILPPQSYNYNSSTISCSSAGVSLPLNQTSDSQNLVVKLSPPCTQCTAGSPLKFTISSLRNPCYISDSNQLVIINTRSVDGVIESGQKIVTLLPANIALNSYVKPVSGQVGTEYELKFGLGLPEYVRINGGQIVVLFSPMSVYNDGQVSGQTYTSPSYSLNITYNNSQVANSVQYYPTSPPSISKLTLQICQTPQFSCAPSITSYSVSIKNLKLGYIPGQQSTDILRITTKYGQLLSERTIDSSLYAPVLGLGALGVQFTKSVTNSFSDLVLRWTANQIVFDRIIAVTLPTQVKVYGQCMIASNLGFVTSFTCSKISDNSITISCDFDPSFMISQNINYWITITNVSTPVSTAPLTYTLQTTYNSIKNLRYTTRSSVVTPLPLSLPSTPTRSNQTINQDFILRIPISPITLLYDSYQIMVPKSTMLTQKDWLAGYPYSLTENTTAYLLDKAGLVVNNAIEIKGRNNLVTGVTPKVWVGLLQAGYLVQGVEFQISPNFPVLLTCNISITNRTVGVFTNLTIACDRNSNGELSDSNLLVKLPSAGFSYSQATFNNQPIPSNLVVTCPITLTSPRIISLSIQSLRNLLYIPILSMPSASNSLTDIDISTTQSDTSKIVGKGSISAVNYMPIDPYDMPNCTATRANLKSGDKTTIKIVCRTVFGVDGFVMAIRLPLEQNSFGATSGCTLGDTAEQCAILSINATDMHIKLKPNVTITLTDVNNIFPNSNNLSLWILTYPQLQYVEQCSIPITPLISLQPLTLIPSATSQKTGETSTVTLELKPTSIKIESTNTLRISLPTKTYTRIFNDDCSVRQASSTNNFTGCTYVFDGDWLVGVQVAGVGGADVQVNASLFVTFGVVNAWAPYSFAGKSIGVVVFKNGASTSQGSCLLTSMYSTPSFTLLPISPSTPLSQTSLESGSTSTVSLSLCLQGNIGKVTRIWYLLPKDTFLFTVGNNSSNLVLERQDTLYYYISAPVTCTTVFCKDYLHQVAVDVRNVYFVKNMRNPLIFYATYDSIINSDSYSVASGSPKPLLPPSLRLTRSQSTSTKQTAINISFYLSQPSLLISSIVSIDLSLNITSPVQDTYYSYLQQTSSTTNASWVKMTGVSIAKNGEYVTYSIPADIATSTMLQTLVVEGFNALQVPIGLEHYLFTIRNSTHVLYQQVLIFPQKLIPLSEGLTINRLTTTVGATTQLSLTGTIPVSNLTLSSYSISINSQVYPCPWPVPTSLNLALSQSVSINPMETSSSQTMAVSVCNISHCIYRQPSALIVPALTPILLTPVDLSVTVPMKMVTANNYTAVIGFVGGIIAKKSLRVVGDARVWEKVGAVIGVAIDGTRMTQANGDFLVVVNTTGNQQSITITPKPSKLLSLMSLQISFTAYRYQQTISYSINLQYSAPSSTFTINQTATIIATELQANIVSSSYKTKALANYTISVGVMPRPGLLSLEFPTQLSGIVNGSAPILEGVVVGGVNYTNQQYSMKYNQTKNTYTLIIQLNSTQLNTTTPIPSTIILGEVVNPKDSGPLVFVLSQQELSTWPSSPSIYGAKILSMQADILDNITVYSAIRNDSKIGNPIELVLDVRTLGTEDPDIMIFGLPSSQVVVRDGAQCVTCVDNNCEGFQTIVNASANTISISPHIPGHHNYSLSGCLTNSPYSQAPSPTDKVSIKLSTPYPTATSSVGSTPYITPILSTGQIKLLSYSSTSNNNLEYSTLRFELQPENYLNCDGVLVVFVGLGYWVHEGTKVQVNAETSGAFAIVNSTSVFVKVTAKKPVLVLTVTNVINYIKNEGFIISSLRKKLPGDAYSPTQPLLSSAPFLFNSLDYGLADQYVSSSPNSTFTPLAVQTRLILPDPYLSTSPKKIMVISDFSIPAQVPTSTLKIKFSSSVGCSQEFNFNQTITQQCILGTAGPATFNVQLIDTKMPSTTLTNYVKYLYIYPQPKSVCVNSLCQQCADGPTGEYCFSCRQGLFSDNGQCVAECPENYFAYNGQTCTQCSSSCASCYDLFDNSCLACKNSILLLDSGSCRNYCQSGFPYQAKFCVKDEECQNIEGCRLCSSTGFCYQCLPDFAGQPKCKSSELLPKNFFIFWIIPILLLLPIVSLVTCIKVGRQTYSHMLIFLLAVIELMSWILMIPKMPQQVLAVIMCAFLLLKIIISIVAYETYYARHITLSKQQKLLENQRESDQKTQHEADSSKKKQAVKDVDSEEITHKQRLVRFSAHFLSCDAYQLIMHKLGKPYTSLTHFTPYFIITMLNRVIVMGFLFYILVQFKPQADVLSLPLIAQACGIGIILTRVLVSDKFAACVNKIRGQ